MFFLLTISAQLGAWRIANRALEKTQSWAGGLKYITAGSATKRFLKFVSVLQTRLVVYNNGADIFYYGLVGASMKVSWIITGMKSPT